MQRQQGVFSIQKCFVNYFILQMRRLIQVILYNYEENAPKNLFFTVVKWGNGKELCPWVYASGPTGSLTFAQNWESGESVIYSFILVPPNLIENDHISAFFGYNCYNTLKV